MKTPALIFKPRKEKRLLNGHPWIYKTEIDRIEGDFTDGDIVDFQDHRGRFLGRGYANTRSIIVARLLTPERQTIDASFFRNRILNACSYRDQWVHHTNACRAVYSESDLLPGLIVDRYGDYLVVQFLTLGMDRWKEAVIDILEDYFHPKGIIERSDTPVRRHEGLSSVKSVLRGDCPELIDIQEYDRSYLVDVMNGQKTGFFLDQRENRQVVAALADGARVLDGCCHTGGFTLAAAKGGAREVTGVDTSADALMLARKNAAYNAMDACCQFIEGNIFDCLRVYNKKQDQFDLIILDPPAFTRGKSSLPGAVRGYKDINLRAIRLLSPGGYLVTCSCSYYMTDDLFRDVVLDAACDAERTVRVADFRTQAPDHPVLLAAPETHYLKCLVIQVM